jgi:NADH-quinone oxidoreductase subunit N
MADTLAPAQIVIGETLTLAPALILGVTALLVLLADTVSPEEESGLLPSVLSATGSILALAVAGVFLVEGIEASPFGGQLRVDGMSNFFVVVFGSVTALVAVASYDYLDERAFRAEYYSLVMLAATGMSLMASANSLATAFVALELSSLPSYVLVAYIMDYRGSVEAGL